MSRGWPLIADTTLDVAHKEQLSICVRLVHPNDKISEHLLACQRAVGTTAEALFRVILSKIDSKGVSFDKLVAQTYDGAANMSGYYNGLQALIQNKLNKNVWCVHCYAHSLNLVLSDIASVAVDVVTLFGNLETMYVLFSKSNSANDVFEEVQQTQGLPVRSLTRPNTVR